jgi:hypothetical protein
MLDDPIVAVVRAIRDRHAASFNYDLDAIYRDIKEREKASGRSYVRYAPRRCRKRGRKAQPEGRDRSRVEQTAP